MKFKNFLIALLVILLILALGAGYLMLTGHVPNPFETQKQATITAEEVEEQISKAADLSTAKLTYKGIVNFTEGQIKYITQNSFNMMYTADIVAGVDMTKVTVDVVQPEGGNPGKVTVTVPKPTIQTVTIDPDSPEVGAVQQDREHRRPGSSEGRRGRCPRELRQEGAHRHRSGTGR